MATHSLFRLPQELLQRLGWSHRPSVAMAAPPPASTRVEASEPFCSVCQWKGDDVRSHAKTDWHRFNLQRKVHRGLQPLSEEEFEALEEVSSIDASDESDSEASDGGEEAEVGVKRLQGSPFAAFAIQDTETALLVYRQALLPKQAKDAPGDAYLKALRACQLGEKPMYWTIVMGTLQAPCLTAEQGNPWYTKPFIATLLEGSKAEHRAVCISNDASKGAAHSAGADLRRYNEQALRKEIKDLLLTWKPHLDASSTVVVHAPSNNRKLVFFDDSPLRIDDDRTRTIPFTTRRPTLAELQRVFTELSTARIQDIKSEDDQSEAQEDETPRVIESVQKQVKNLKVEDASNEVEAVPEYVTKLIDFASRGKIELFMATLQSAVTEQQAQESIINQELASSEGPTLLHIASRHGQADMVAHLLELGASPVAPPKSKQPYDIAGNKETRNAFRRYMAVAPERWDYAAAHVPGPLTAEMEAEQKQKEKDKKKALRDKRKEADKERKKNAPTPEPEEPPPPPPPSKSKRLGSALMSKSEKEASGMSAERRALLDREKRAMAAEARMRSMQNRCAACDRSLVGTTPFEKFQYKYCSIACLQVLPSMLCMMRHPHDCW